MLRWHWLRFGKKNYSLVPLQKHSKLGVALYNYFKLTGKRNNVNNILWFGSNFKLQAVRLTTGGHGGDDHCSSWVDQNERIAHSHMHSNSIWNSSKISCGFFPNYHLSLALLISRNDSKFQSYNFLTIICISLVCTGMYNVLRRVHVCTIIRTRRNSAIQ